MIKINKLKNILTIALIFVIVYTNMDKMAMLLNAADNIRQSIFTSSRVDQPSVAETTTLLGWIKGYVGL